MFCPKCRTEYLPGTTRCPECNVSLVEELTPENHKVNNYRKVLSLSTAEEVALLKSILDDNDIEYYFQGENFNALRLMLEPAILMIRDDQAESVEILLKELQNEDNTCPEEEEAEEHPHIIIQ